MSGSAPTLPSTPSVTQIGLGTLIGIGPVVGTSSPTYTTIGQITDAKLSGAKATVIKFSTLDGGLAVQKRKGTVDYGTVQISYERKPADADTGQAAAKAAFADTVGVYMFQAALFTGPGQTTAGDIAAFTGIVSEFTEITDLSPNKNIEGSITIELSSAIVITAGS